MMVGVETRVSHQFRSSGFVRSLKYSGNVSLWNKRLVVWIEIVDLYVSDEWEGVRFGCKRSTIGASSKAWVIQILIESRRWPSARCWSVGASDQLAGGCCARRSYRRSPFCKQSRSHISIPVNTKHWMVRIQERIFTPHQLSRVEPSSEAAPPNSRTPPDPSCVMPFLRFRWSL